MVPMPRTKPSKNPLRRRLGRNAIIYAVLAIAAIWLVGSVIGRGAQPQELRFYLFMEKVEHDQVRSANMFLRDQRIEGELSNHSKYRTTYAGDGDTLAS